LTLAFVGSNPAIPASSTCEGRLLMQSRSIAPAVRFEKLRFQTFIQSNIPGSSFKIQPCRFRPIR